MAVPPVPPRQPRQNTPNPPPGGFGAARPRPNIPTPGPQHVVNNNAPPVANKATSDVSGLRNKIRESVGRKVADVSERVRTDEGRATLEHGLAKSANTSLRNFIQRQSGRKGSFMLRSLGMMAQHFLQSHVAKLGHDQKIFEQINHLRRGDTNRLTHQQLRDMADHADTHGGPHAASIKQAAALELERREEARTIVKRTIRQREIKEDEDIRTKRQASRHQQTMQHKAEAHAADRAHREETQASKSQFQAESLRRSREHTRKNIAARQAGQNKSRKQELAHISRRQALQQEGQTKKQRSEAKHLEKTAPLRKSTYKFSGPSVHVHHHGNDTTTLRKMAVERRAAMSNKPTEAAKPKQTASRRIASSGGGAGKKFTVLRQTKKGATVKTAGGKTEWMSREEMSGQRKAGRKAAMRSHTRGRR